MSGERWVFVWTKEHKFRRSSKLTTQCSLLTTQKRLEDVDMNSRGLLSPRLFMTYIIMASAKTRIGNPHRTSASFRRHFFLLSIIPRVQEPAAIRPAGFPSSRRFFPTNVYHNVMLNLFQHLTASPEPPNRSFWWKPRGQEPSNRSFWWKSRGRKPPNKSFWWKSRRRKPPNRSFW